MPLSSWWQITTPHRDIREGKLTEAIFAADLGDVAKGTAPLEYSDALTFFQKTYLTNGLKNLIENVFNRLNGGKADPVIQLQTPFGGGKTHALVTLYHIVKNYSQIKHLPQIEGLKLPTNTKVVVFVGIQADALKGRTPWGEIAYQLERYDIIKDHDQKRISPGKEKLKEVLSSQPVLILIDELLEYIVKASRSEKTERVTQGQTLAFLQEITEVVAGSQNACLVITLPASILETYDEQAEQALTQLQKVSGRVETVYTPVEGIEIYEVIRKRLFEDIGEERTRKEVSQYYFDFYQRLGEDVPPEVRTPEYREKIEYAYPFHPELIDILYERWGSFPTFQRTRGVLRLLAEVVSDLYNRKLPSALIHSSLVNLGNPAIRREFIKHIGNEYESVIASDIIGKASEIDRQMGSEYEKYRIATGITTSVFLYSFSGGERKGITLPRIRVALLREGIPQTIVGDAVAKLEEQLWYFHSEKKQFAFRNQPNLNRVILQKEETISDEQVLEELKRNIQKHQGKAFAKIYVWPEEPSDVSDDNYLKLIISAPKYLNNSEETEQFASKIFERAGTSFRVFKNTLFILSMDGIQYGNLLKSLRRFLAINEVVNDKGLFETLSNENQQEIKTKLKEAEKKISTAILYAYRHLAFLDKTGLIWKDLGIPTTGTEHNLSDRVMHYLKDQEKILSRLTPKFILEKTFANDENEKELKEIYNLFLKTPGLPLLEDEEVLLNAVKDGVKSGLFGLKEMEEIYFKQEIEPKLDSIILRGEIAKEKKEEEIKAEKAKEKGPIEPDEKVTRTLEAQEKAEKRVTKILTFRAEIPWDKLSDVIKGVIGPLKEKSETIKIFIEITANSKEGFDRTTLDSKVKETLKQIGAKEELWQEE